MTCLIKFAKDFRINGNIIDIHKLMFNVAVRLNNSIRIYVQIKK